MTDSNPPKSTKPASPFDSLLAQCRDLVSERLSKAMDVMLDKVDETLSDLIFDSPDRDMRALYLETRDKALAQRETIAQQFRAQYLREFQVRSNRVKKIGQSFSDVDASFAELNLVGEDDLNETLKLNDMATKLRQYCDDELLALDQRVGVLLGDANLEAEDNPFSPHAICEAFKNTSRSFESNVKVRMVLLKLFDDHVLDDIRSVYKAVNALLVQNSILPKIRYGGVSRGKEDGKSPPAATPAAVPAAAERSPSDGPDFFSVLQDLLASGAKAAVQPGATGGSAPGVVANPAAPGGSAPGVASNPAAPGVGGAGGAPMVVLQGAELMGFLTRMQHGDAKAAAEAGLPAPDSGGERDSMANILRELKGTSFSNGMNQMDVMTLDIVAMLFDQLFDDPKIPIAVKGLIGRMQIPMLKVAIADKAFFSKKSHPARRLLDTLGEISSRLPGEFNASNPLFGRLEGIIQELMNNFQDNMEIFDVVRERLQNLVEEEDQRSEEQTQAAAKRIELDERLAASKTMAEYEVKTRVEAGNLPRPVIEFLVHQWIKPLLIVHVRRGQHSDAWKNSLATMDLLIWSVEAKHTPEERSKLATVVPDLLKRLAAGLTIADIEDAIRERFFSDLNKLHTEAMGMGEGGKIAAAPDDSGGTGAAKPDIEFAVTPRPEPEETVQTIPITAIEVPDLSQIQLLDPKETVQPTPAVATGPLELPQIHLPEPKVTVQPTQAVANEPLELSPVHLPEPKETAEPTPAPATEPLELPPIHFPEPKETVQPIPAATSHAPATPKIPVPAPSQAPKPMSPSAGHAPVPPKIPVPDPRQPVRPTPQTAAPASTPPRPSVQVSAQPVRPTPQSTAPAPAPPRPSVQVSAQPVRPTPQTAAPASTLPRPSVQVSAQPVRPTPQKAAPVPTPPRPSVQVPGQPVRPTLQTAAQAPAARGTTVQASRQTGKAIPPSAPRARTPVVAETAESDSLDFTKVLTIKNPFGGGKVNVEELESTELHAAAAPRAKGEANEVEFIKNLKEGTWVEFREKETKDTKDTHRPAKLSYISPLRSRFLFIDQMGKTVKECSRTDLGRLVRLGVVVVVDVVADETPLFDRMMAGVIGKLT